VAGVTTLPNTGAGPSDRLGGRNDWLLVIVSAVVLVAAGFGLRRAA
jgi:hypothetical protein